MPRRNLLVLVIATIVALVCSQRVQKNPYGRVVANAMARIESRALEPVGALKLFEGAMEGMVDKLDDYSAYISPDDVKAFHETIDQEFGGVGMEVALDPQTKQIIVLSPLVGSPAYRGGIRAGDKILRIDQDSTQGMSLKDAVGLLRGKPGDPVMLTVLHEGEEKPVEVKIVRDRIQVDTVLGDTRNADGSWNFFLEGRDRIGYIRISSFTDKTFGEMQQALAWLTEHDMQGLVLDLRDDPGGYLDAAIDVCDLLISSGVIVTTRRRDGRISQTYAASGEAQFTDFPIAVLVNQLTASAAEIVAACLQDHHRAVVIGQQSYGKGTVQEVMDLEKGCGAMKITTASYWRPSGRNIHRSHDAGDWGVSPDEGYTVMPTGDEQVQWRVWRAHRDLFQNGAAKNGNAKNGNAKNGEPKNGDEPFLDRPLAKGVEYVEKEATEKP